MIVALAVAVFVTWLSVPDRDAPLRWLDGAKTSSLDPDPIEMEVTVPPRVAAMLREHPVPGVRVAGTLPER